MIDSASSWFKIVELPVTTDAVIPTDTKGQKGTKPHNSTKFPYFDKSSTMISHIVNKTWVSHYPRCQYYNGSKFKLHFEALCESYGIKRKPTSVKNPQANAILEQLHQVLTTMLRTAEIDMANTVAPSDIDAFLTNAAWAIRSTYHTVLKASPGAAIFGRDMLFDIPFMLTGTKLEITGNTKQTSTPPVKIAHAVTGTTRLVIKYFLEKMVSSANQKVGMKVILGLSHQFIQMEQSGFNAEQSLNDSTSGE